MSQKIKVKRGLKSKLPMLDVGEFGLCTDTNELYIGSDSGNILVAYNTIGNGLTFEDWNPHSEQVILIDEIPPEKISKIMVYYVDKTTVKLKWKKSSSKDVKSYSIYNNSMLIGSTTDTNYTINGLSSGTLFNISITAIDQSNNESVATNTLIKTHGNSVLYMDGNSFIETPTLTYNVVEMTCAIDPIQGVTSFIIDGRNGLPRIYYSRNSSGYDDVGLDWSSVYLNGVIRRLGSSNIQTNTKTIIRLEFVDPVMDNIHLFANLINQSSMRGKLYNAKVMNGDNVVAYYDFTEQFSGNSIPDMSGNGQNATLSGGTWITE